MTIISIMIIIIIIIISTIIIIAIVLLILMIISMFFLAPGLLMRPWRPVGLLRRGVADLICGLPRESLVKS